MASAKGIRWQSRLGRSCCCITVLLLLCVTVLLRVSVGRVLTLRLVALCLHVHCSAHIKRNVSTARLVIQVCDSVVHCFHISRLLIAYYLWKAVLAMIRMVARTHCAWLKLCFSTQQRFFWCPSVWYHLRPIPRSSLSKLCMVRINFSFLEIKSSHVTCDEVLITELL